MQTYTTTGGSYKGIKYISHLNSFLVQFDFELVTIEGLKNQSNPDFNPDRDFEDINGSLFFLIDHEVNIKISWNLPNDVSNREELENKITSLLDVHKKVGYVASFVKDSTILKLIKSIDKNGIKIEEENMDVKDYGHTLQYRVHFIVNNDSSLNFRAVISKNSLKPLSVFVEDPVSSMLEWTKIEGLFNEDYLLSFFTTKSTYAYIISSYINHLA